MRMRRQPTTQEHAKVNLGYRPLQVSGRNWHKVDEGTYIRSIQPNARVPKDASAVTPDVRKGGRWRIAWLFLGGVVVMVGMWAATLV